MRLNSVAIRNFRRLENVLIDIEDQDTLFVGPNNSGKTSATAIFRCFLGGREFRIHDFSVSRMSDFEAFSASGDPSNLPEIQLDLWFAIDPDSVAYGRVFSLLPNLEDFESVGLRLSFGFADPAKLRTAYNAAYPPEEDGSQGKTLFQYLAMDTNLARHSIVRFASLVRQTDEENNESIHAAAIEPEEGKRLLKHLVRVEFVDAQRNINDDESSRSNRLSSAFAAFYRKNLQDAGPAADAHKVIDENNSRLTDHYEIQFAPLIDLIKGLGVPSVNDRDLRIISSLSPETALKGNTELLYVDPARKHELPELYNGLGFKNLIYMAIQVRHFHSQWLATPENRPLCLLIFIEEPEVHLHAQVQQAFITNIWKVIKDSAEAAGLSDAVPQIVVTTHSSHILDAVDFAKVRYFQRCHSANDDAPGGIRNVSDVRSLRAFQPEGDIVDGVVVSSQEALDFLKRYLRLTHCDLFFADAAILVEGAVEKLLLPIMIEKSANKLRSSYLTVLEVGGAYAYRFEGLLSFLRIPYLVITDLDSVTPDAAASACRGDTQDARTSNASLKNILGKSTVDELMALGADEKISDEKDCCIAFQCDITVTDQGSQRVMRPRTLEEAFAYDNFSLLREGKITIGKAIPHDLDAAYQTIYDRIRSSTFKKTDFAMSLLAGDELWQTPAYIAEGLVWLEAKLYPPIAQPNGPLGVEEPAPVPPGDAPAAPLGHG
ncbi:AAA family ATPase [Shinella daejeonensis]|uniref:ATP-dependent nuclease n=1 Tax=Hyphomicrobiales TaxID=356 RepID=UPI0020C8200C|nr:MULTISPECIES: AAA family ATPase [Hyphomicrobiales]MCK9551350.1 AAA family ATPase [Aquamicrobium sp.]MCP8896033.1 AAA family ATPase [Shinella daejeonensis]